MMSIDSRRVETDTCLECFDGRRECLLTPCVEVLEASFTIATEIGSGKGLAGYCREARLPAFEAADAAGGGHDP